MKDLTPREIRILQFSADGFGNKQIAAELGTSEQTIKNYKRLIFATLGASGIANAVATALRRGLID